MVSALGFVAGTLTTLAFLPQVLHTWRTKSAAGLSIVMVLQQMLGVALWVGYGVLIDSAPIVVANVLTFAVAAVLLALKLKYRDAPTAGAANRVVSAD